MTNVNEPIIHNLVAATKVKDDVTAASLYNFVGHSALGLRGRNILEHSISTFSPIFEFR